MPLYLKSTRPLYMGADLGLSMVGSLRLRLLSTGAAVCACAAPPSWSPASLARMMSTSPEQDLSSPRASSMVTPLINERRD